MAVRIGWADGGEGSIEAIDGDRITLTSSRAFAPGSRPEGTLGLGQRVWLKVHGSRRQADGSFRVVGRLLNATRDLRETLKEVVSGPIGGKSPNS